MKNFITNNWKKILIVIGAIFIIINIFSKLTVGKTLLQDYIKYGKDIEKSEVGVDVIENVGEVVTQTNSPFGPEAMKLVILLIVLILLVVFLTSLGDKAAAKAKAKKK